MKRLKAWWGRRTGVQRGLIVATLVVLGAGVGLGVELAVEILGATGNEQRVMVDGSDMTSLVGLMVGFTAMVLGGMVVAISGMVVGVLWAIYGVGVLIGRAAGKRARK